MAMTSERMSGYARQYGQEVHFYHHFGNGKLDKPEFGRGTSRLYADSNTGI